jgi:hypothetical protein
MCIIPWNAVNLRVRYSKGQCHEITAHFLLNISLNLHFSGARMWFCIFILSSLPYRELNFSFALLTKYLLIYLIC